jgi:5'(3')-deoxyribonucleotidase
VNILLDIDGVAAGFAEAVIDLVWEKYSRQVFMNEIGTFDLFSHLSLTREQIDAIRLEIDQPGFCASIGCYSGAADFVTGLREAGHTVFAVTAPWETSPTWSYERTDWVNHHLGIPAHHVVLTAAKELVQGAVLIDDSIRNIRRWSEAHPQGLALLVTQPWNEREEWPHRARTFDEMLQCIQKFFSEEVAA